MMANNKVSQKIWRLGEKIRFFLSKSGFFKRQTTLLTRLCFLDEESSSDTGPASNEAKSPAEVIEIQEF